MSNVSNSTKKPISKSAITAIVFAVISIPLAFGKPVLAKFFCSIFVDVSIVFAVISLVTVFGTRKHGNAILARLLRGFRGISGHCAVDVRALTRPTHYDIPPKSLSARRMSIATNNPSARF